MRRFFTGNAIIKTANIKFVPFTGSGEPRVLRVISKIDALHDNEKNTPLTHVNTSGEANIVDITHKSPTLRIARAKADIFLPNNIAHLIRENQIKKGDVLIWHANLMHGGNKHVDKSKTRKSMVFHYFSENVVSYHEFTQRPALIKE